MHDRSEATENDVARLQKFSPKVEAAGQFNHQSSQKFIDQILKPNKGIMRDINEYAKEGRTEMFAGGDEQKIAEFINGMGREELEKAKVDALNMDENSPVRQAIMKKFKDEIGEMKDVSKAQLKYITKAMNVDKNTGGLIFKTTGDAGAWEKLQNENPGFALDVYNRAISATGNDRKNDIPKSIVKERDTYKNYEKGALGGITPSAVVEGEVKTKVHKDGKGFVKGGTTAAPSP